MSSDATRRRGAMRPDGPVESYAWPEKLEARVVAPGEAPRLHGYDVEGDLCANYSFSETLLLSLTGELPDEMQAAAFDVALQFLSPLSIAHAPTHAAVLARISGAPLGSVAAIAVVTLAERAREIVQEHAPFIAWLERWSVDPTAKLTPEFGPTSDADRASADRLQRALADRGVPSSARPAGHELGRTPALLAALHFSGLKVAEQLEAAFVMGGLASTLAEARAWKFSEFRDYPMNLPRFVYEEGDG